MDNYISKPFEPESLLIMIGRYSAAKGEKPRETKLPSSLASPPTNPAPMDGDVLVARCMGNLAFAQSLLANFESGLPE